MERSRLVDVHVSIHLYLTRSGNELGGNFVDVDRYLCMAVTGNAFERESQGHVFIQLMCQSSGGLRHGNWYLHGRLLLSEYWSLHNSDVIA